MCFSLYVPVRKDSEEGETMKKVRVQDAVGMVLCHDMTEIVPGKFKGRAFKKGHVVKEEDIEKLLDIGKRYLYVWDLEEGYVHEQISLTENREKGKLSSGHPAGVS